jgi:hypothetical protein
MYGERNALFGDISLLPEYEGMGHWTCEILD